MLGLPQLTPAHDREVLYQTKRRQKAKHTSSVLVRDYTYRWSFHCTATSRSLTQKNGLIVAFEVRRGPHDPMSTLVLPNCSCNPHHDPVSSTPLSEARCLCHSRREHLRDATQESKSPHSTQQYSSHGKSSISTGTSTMFRDAWAE